VSDQKPTIFHYKVSVFLEYSQTVRKFLEKNQLRSLKLDGKFSNKKLNTLHLSVDHVVVGVMADAKDSQDEFDEVESKSNLIRYFL